MLSIEIWYLRCIQYVLRKTYTIFHTKFTYIFCKFDSVQSFDYSGNNNLICFHTKEIHVLHVKT